MPRIDPFQLLKCLSVLLSPEGGILSQDEVPRLVNLMTKFSKKLVSKCVYILILKNTEQPLVNLFMAEGGWNLIHTWLQDAIHISNWDLVKEILSLLLVTPVDVERLKSNNIPKLVKSLSRLEVKGVQDLSTQLVHDWLVIVKGNTKVDDVAKTQSVDLIKAENIDISEAVPDNNVSNDTVDTSQINALNDPQAEEISPSTFYKVTVRDGKQVISRTASIESSIEEATADIPTELIDSLDIKKDIKEKKFDDKNKTVDKTKSKSRSSSKHSSSSSSNRSKTSSSSSKDKHKSSSSSSSKSSSRDKERERDKKDRHKANGVKSSGSSGSHSNNKDKTDQKDKQAEKDKDTLAKIRPQSIDKLGRIPKKTDDKSKENKEIKKPTMSIEVRKIEERPKTVKVFNSKRRSTGLEEEAKPPPPRPTKKPAVVLPTIPQKRSSPVKDLPTPPEKKIKIDIPERPGAIKLIPPKPKRNFWRWEASGNSTDSPLAENCFSSLLTDLIGNGRSPTVFTSSLAVLF